MAKYNPNIVYIPGTSIPWMTKKYGGTDKRILNQRINARIKPTSTAALSIRKAITHGIAQSMVADTGITLGAAMVAAHEGVLDGLSLLDKDIKTTPPIVPMSPGGGTLRTSWNVETMDKKGYEFYVEAGFNAIDKDTNHPYAVYVHEMTDEAYGKKIKWTVPGSGAKFLEKGLQRNADWIVQKVVDNVRKVTMKP